MKSAIREICRDIPKQSLSDKDADWLFPTAASSNWLGSTWNGDPLAVEGTTVAVDFSRIPRGSLIYIPSLNMYAEANDTGATALWAQSDSGLNDYGTNGAGRIDIYNLAGGRSSGQVQDNFESRGWKQRVWADLHRQQRNRLEKGMQ